MYVPALRHLLEKYTVPEESNSLKLKAQCLLACGGYVEAAYIGYPNGFWWNVLVASSTSIAGKLVTANIPVNVGGSVHDCKFVISDGQKQYGLVACDQGEAESGWLTGAANSAKQLESEYRTHRTAFIVREIKGAFPKSLPGTKVRLIVGTDVAAVTDGFVAAMTN